MGGAYGVLCPTLQIGTLSFPWTTGNVTSSNPTSGSDQQETCDESEESPETVAAAPRTVSRDQSLDDDYGKTTPDNPLPVLTNGDGVVTSQPKAEVEVTLAAPGRRRFRDTALAVTTKIREIDNSPELRAMDAEKLESPAAECISALSGDVPDSVPTSTRTSEAAADRLESSAGGYRSTLLEEILRARAKAQKVSGSACWKTKSVSIAYSWQQLAKRRSYRVVRGRIAATSFIDIRKSTG